VHLVVKVKYEQMKKKERTERQANEVVEVVYVDGDFWCYFERKLEKKWRCLDNFVTI
jgi:hypothetical protein